MKFEQIKHASTSELIAFVDHPSVDEPDGFTISYLLAILSNMLTRVDALESQVASLIASKYGRPEVEIVASPGAPVALFTGEDPQARILREYHCLPRNGLILNTRTHYALDKAGLRTVGQVEDFLESQSWSSISMLLEIGDALVPPLIAELARVKADFVESACREEANHGRAIQEL